MKRKISILGSTGSIGRQSLEVIEAQGFEVFALTANRSTGLLEEQARRFKPQLVAVYDEVSAADLKMRLADTGIRVASGAEGLIEAAALDEIDTVITAVVGTVGLKPTMAAIEKGKRIALANKETLVCAGRMVMQAARENGAEIIPVDSEHSAIFQSLQGGKREELKKILLTASGGPFRGKSFDEMRNASKSDALNHPNWSMGAKITIDSASMMNKGLEFIEAMHLFGVKPEQIEVLVHPQSIVHSMVEFCDNSVIAQLGMPDMRIPIQYALTYPLRSNAVADRIDFTKISALTFEKPDLTAFKCLALAIKTADKPGAACAVMNAANEEAVGLFLEDRIKFGEIYELVSEAVDILGNLPADSVDEVLAADNDARKFVLGKA